MSNNCLMFLQSNGHTITANSIFIQCFTNITTQWICNYFSNLIICDIEGNFIYAIAKSGSALQQALNRLVSREVPTVPSVTNTVSVPTSNQSVANTASVSAINQSATNIVSMATIDQTIKTTDRKTNDLSEKNVESTVLMQSSNTNTQGSNVKTLLKTLQQHTTEYCNQVDANTPYHLNFLKVTELLLGERHTEIHYTHNIWVQDFHKLFPASSSSQFINKDLDIFFDCEATNGKPIELGFSVFSHSEGIIS